MRLPRYSIVVACVILAAGCGGDDKIDADAKEREIAADVERSTATDDVKVECPEVEKKKESVFECELSAAGGVKATVKVTQLDDKGDEIYFEVNP